MVAHRGHWKQTGGDKVGHGRTDPCIHVPVHRHQDSTDSIYFAVVQCPRAGGQEITGPGMPGFVEIVELDHRQPGSRRHTPVVMIDGTASGDHRCQGRAVVVIIPGTHG